MIKKYKTILIDPPWQQELSGRYKNFSNLRTGKKIGYKTMSLEEIQNLPIEKIADEGCHLWLWTTNQFLEQGFQLIRGWGFIYLAPIHWIKPSGRGNYFVHYTQTILFAYYKRCLFKHKRYLPNYFKTEKNPAYHSRKPVESYRLIESISCEPRLELFARPHSPMFPKLPGWDVWGNEMPENDIDLFETNNHTEAANENILHRTSEE